MNRLNPLHFAVATTVTFLLLYVACALAVALFPDGTVSFFNAWFHGLDLDLLKPPGGRPLTSAQFATGFAGVIVVAFPAGLVLASVYDFLLGSPRPPLMRTFATNDKSQPASSSIRNLSNTETVSE